ncbi:uncharacterized protein LOC127259378 [Andrographis paniculata]|uniref:uncharacterized protein LOC127259378 n=1 Tax=Andrographis paniculata TaxID=175694 RepID=UPI0021E8DE60|nr:uncharacterized protein LOC127259378 [Andrographis paniculata]
MAQTTIVALAMALSLAMFLQASLGGKIECEDLKETSCAYAVSSSGKRCVLEKQASPAVGGRRSRGGAAAEEEEEEYACRESEIEAEGVKDWVESEECVKACGVDRSALGISSDSLLESHFAKKLCSHQCYHGCPNIVDLYFNLAAGEGVYLPKFCEAQRKNGRREMAELISSGSAAVAPEGPKGVGFYSGGPAPAPEPAFF